MHVFPYSRRPGTKADAMPGQLTREEKETLADGALLMTLEVGVRFLKDYLDGDVYFRISDPKQNLSAHT